MRDEFLSEEDLDLKTMSEEELDAYWNAWLEQRKSPTRRTPIPTRTECSLWSRRMRKNLKG